jgi:tetratricopeptide (TPR) repeat protein
MAPERVPRPVVLAPLLVAALAAALTLRPIDDFDVWYHLAAGRLIWQTWHWPTVNTFAFTTPDHPWIDLHWIFQLLLYAAYSLGGPLGCTLFAVALMLVTVGLLYGLARRSAPPAVVALLLAVALLVASPRFVPRPELLSFALFATYLWILESYPRSGRMIYWLVPLQLLWTNSQGIFAIGLALIGCYWLGATLVLLPFPRGWREASGGTPRDWRRLTLVLLLASAACLVNPYGVEGVRFPLVLLPRVTGSSLFSERIGEFRAPFESGYAPPLAYLWVGLLAVAGLSFLARPRRVHLGRLFATVAFGVLSTRALRNMALFAWIAVPAIAANVGALLMPRQPAASRPATRAERRSAAAAASRAAGPSAGASRATAPTAGARPAVPPVVARLGAAAVALALAVLVLAVATNRFARFLDVDTEFGFGVSRLRFPIAAVEFAREVGITGRGFNCLPMGGYLTWQRFPEERVFVDGRLEAYPESFFRTYFRILDDPRVWPQVAALYRLDYALVYHAWSNRYPLLRYLAEGHGWTLVYYDENTSLFLPVDEEHRELRERAARRFAELRTHREQESAAPPRSWLGGLSIPVERIRLLTSYGEYLRMLGLGSEAIAAYQRVLALDPDASGARFALGVAYWQTGESERAVREWRDVLRRDPGYERARSALDEVQTPATTP